MDRQKVGRYEIIREIGRGGMGVVYLAHDPNTDRDLAVKMLDLRGFTKEQSDEISERFQREAKAAGRLGDCHNIIKIYDAAEHEGEYYIAMEYAPGKSLEDILEEDPIMPPERVLEIIEGIAHALDHAHSMGIVHRDIKPANVLITDKGMVKVTDFGIARIENLRMTRTGAMLGSPSYMSPEQILGKEIDGTSDVFALGVILYIMLTGEKPFPGESLATLTYRIVQENPTAPSQINTSLNASYDQLMANALAKDQKQRYQTAGELARDLRNIIAPGQLPPDFGGTLSTTKSSVGLRAGSMPSLTAIPISGSTGADATNIVTGVQIDSLGQTRKLPPRRFMIAVGIFAFVVLVGLAIVVPRFFRGDESFINVSPGNVAMAEGSEVRVGIVPKTHVLWRQALDARAKKENTKALEALKQLEMLDPTDAEVVLAVAKVNYDLHRYSDAMVGYKRALQLEPALKDDPDLIAQLIDGIDSGSSKDAMAIIIELIGGSAESRLMEAAAKENKKTSHNAWIALEELWRRKLEENPTDTATRLKLAGARHKLDKPAESIEDFKKVVSEKPEEKNNKALIADVVDMLKSDSYPAATELLVQIGPPALSILRQVPSEKNSKKYDRVLAAIEAILRKQFTDEPGNPQPALELAQTLTASGNNVEAVKFASSALDRNPSLASDSKFIALLLEALKTPESGAADVLGKKVREPAVPVLKSLLKSDNRNQRWGAAHALETMGKSNEINKIDLWIQDLTRPDTLCEDRKIAYENLKTIDTPEVKAAIQKVEGDKKLKKCVSTGQETIEPVPPPGTHPKPTPKPTGTDPKKKKGIKGWFQPK